MERNWPGTRARTIRRIECDWLGHMLSRRDEHITKKAIKWTKRNMETKEYMEERSGEKKWRQQMQLKEYGDSSQR